MAVNERRILAVTSGKRIKSLRIAKGWTQQELSDRSGVSLRTVQRIENGEVKPSLYSLRILAQALDEDVDVILLESEEKNHVPQSKPFQKMNAIFHTFSAIKLPVLGSIGIICLALTTYLFWPPHDLGKSNFNDGSVFEVATVNCGSETECDIEVTKKDKKGTILWQKTFGGTSYDRAGQALAAADGGCLVLGSTSSFGAGNYDALLLRIDREGNLIWQRTYGGFFNEYGKSLEAISGENGYLISGTQQKCPGANVSNDCQDYVWAFEVDEEGNEKG